MRVAAMTRIRGHGPQTPDKRDKDRIYPQAEDMTPPEFFSHVDRYHAEITKLISDKLRVLIPGVVAQLHDASHELTPRHHIHKKES